MNWNASSTRAITSAGGPVGKHPAVPVAPAEIADPAVEALPARAGATVVHLHVRDPETGAAPAARRSFGRRWSGSARPFSSGR